MKRHQPAPRGNGIDSDSKQACVRAITYLALPGYESSSLSLIDMAIEGAFTASNKASLDESCPSL